jgi:hypothetical protein
MRGELPLATWPRNVEKHAGHGLEDQTRSWYEKIRVLAVFFIIFPDFSSKNEV